MLFRVVRKRHLAVGAAVALGLLTMPAQGLAVRYASPTGSALANCQTPATACSLKTAIQGNGGNVPTNGEEVVVLAGSYPTETGDIFEGAALLDIHGESGQPPPVINVGGIGRLAINTSNLSYLRVVEDSTGSGEVINATSELIDRVVVESFAVNAVIPACQCHGPLIRNSVFITHGPMQPALGMESNGASATTTYRNVTAYSSQAGAPPISVEQIGASGTLSFSAFNSIALNGAGGPDVVADGPNSTITFSSSNYRGVSTPDGGVVQDAGAPHQTAPPLFADPGGGDFSELVGSPTIDAGLTDVENGPLDYAGNPRTVNGATDIGAYESLATAPTFTLARKVKINRKGKGRLTFTCTSAAGEVCVVAATVGAGGKAKESKLGRASGTVPAGSKGNILVKLKKAARKRLAAKGKLGAQLSGTVTGANGLSSPLAAPLKLRPKR
ncbi:MAG TPA: choice-of-anchor Q domain-containing protein [Solirubrobacterales bacterium]|jgi:hypothetical protein